MSEALLIVASFLGCALAAVVLQRLALFLSKGQTAVSRSQASPLTTVRAILCTRPARLAGEILAGFIGMQACALFLLISARPFMAFVLVSSVLFLLVVINRAKELILREPLVLADAWLLKQIFRYPEMYFPFLPMKGIALGFALIGLALLGLTAAESPLHALRTAPAGLALATAFALPVAALVLMRRSRLGPLARALLRLCPVGNDAAKDAAENGPLTAAMLHPVLAGLWDREGRDFLAQHQNRPASSHWPPPFEDMLRSIPDAAQDQKGNVIIVQAESFADIRPLLPEHSRSCLKNALPNWEALQVKGQVLPTPDTAFGAYTMRTEFSVLTGLSKDALGPFAFNPYLLAGRQKLWSLARFFKNQGYSTLCLHPYHKDFFRRDIVMRQLGFDRFLALEDLNSLPRFGPHISDIALAEYLQKELAASPRPVFAFVITMEAHGPWRQGRLTPDEITSALGPCNTPDLPEDCRMYLCHLLRMDNMFGLLQTTPTRPTHLWVYGDHDPALSITRS